MNRTLDCAPEAIKGGSLQSAAQPGKKQSSDKGRATRIAIPVIIEMCLLIAFPPSLHWFWNHTDAGQDTFIGIIRIHLGPLPAGEILDVHRIARLEVVPLDRLAINCVIFGIPVYIILMVAYEYLPESHLLKHEAFLSLLDRLFRHSLGRCRFRRRARWSGPGLLRGRGQGEDKTDQDEICDQMEQGWDSAE